LYKGQGLLALLEGDRRMRSFGCLLLSLIGGRVLYRVFARLFLWCLSLS